MRIALRGSSYGVLFALLIFGGAISLWADSPADANAAEEAPQGAAAAEPNDADASSDEEPATEEPPAAPADAPAVFAGQADLDEAVTVKITAENMKDFSRVIELCDQALAKGLDDENKAFARQLLVATRIERADRLAEMIFGTSPPDPRWPQFRQLAMLDLELALATDPDQAEGQLLLAKLNGLPGGDPQRALTAVEAAVRLSDDNPPIKSQALLLRGAMSSDPDQQLADFNAAVEVFPDNPLAVRTRGVFHLTNDDLPAARRDLAHAVQLDPEDAETIEAFGLTLMLLKEYDEAVEQFNQAVELEPEVASMRANRARALAALGKNEEALADLDEALRISPDNLGWQLLRTGILAQAGRGDEALEDVDALIAQRPELIEAVRIKAHILAAAQKLPDAIAEMEKATAAAPDDLELAAELASFYVVSKKPRRAIALYDKVLDRGVKLLPVYRGRADAYLSVGRQREAVADYEEALKLDPKDSGVLNNLAWVLATSPDESLRDGEKSIDLAKRACEETNYEAAHILSTLAAAYAESGDFASAIEWAKKSLKAAEGLDEQTLDQLRQELANYEARRPTRELQNIVEEEPTAPEPQAGRDRDVPNVPVAPPKGVPVDGPRTENPPRR